MTPVCGCQTGIAIYVDKANAQGVTNTQNVTIQNVNLVDFQKAGIVCKTSGNVLIENAVITGEGHTNGTAQNGIQINNSQNAVVNNCEISDLWYDGVEAATGILLVDGAKASVNDTELINVESEVRCYDENAAATVKVGNIITKITYDNQDEGGEIVAVLCTGLSLDKTAVTLKAGEKADLNAIVTPENCTEEVTWSVSDSNLASLEANGAKAAITAKASGTVTVTATCGSYTASATVTIEKADAGNVPTNPADSDDKPTTSDKETGKAPQTGDTAHPGVYVIILLASAAVAVYAVSRRRAR